MDGKSEMRPSWRRIRSFSKAQAVAPAHTGVYVIGESTRLYDLPTRFRWVYVGVSNNVQRRLSEHTSRSEKNRLLRNWLASSMRVEVWYALTNTMNEAMLLEKALVSQLGPEFNTHHKTPEGQYD